MKYKVILFIGAPGTGKSTQIKLLKDDNYLKFSVGDMIRNINKDDDLYELATDCLTKGILIPFEIVLSYLNNFIQEKINTKEFNPNTDYIILDSIPINLEQAHILNNQFDIVQVFHFFHDNDKDLLFRIHDRRNKENRIDDLHSHTTINRIKYYNDHLIYINIYFKSIDSSVNDIYSPDSINDINDRIKKAILM